MLKKNKKKTEVIAVDDSESESPVSVASTSSDESEEYRPRQRRRKSTRNKNKVKPGEALKLAPIFINPRHREKLKKPKISQATKNFLYSGVPGEIVKQQKVIEKQIVEAASCETFDTFPTFTHNISLEDLKYPNPVDFSKSLFPIAVTGEVPVYREKLSWKIGLPNEYVDSASAYDTDALRLGEFCCGLNNFQPSARLRKIMKGIATSQDRNRFPWVEKYKLKRLGHLVVDKETVGKLQDWLKQWSRDIRDDGGTSRKCISKKRKRHDIDSDFIDCGDGELQQKSVILTGPTGSGKTAMVYVLAKRLGFKVVEVNFSSRRSGHDVLRRVEEATLSHRLASTATVDEKHCLLLFKDIDQVFAEEDEGFHSALAQLITASCRPIVMTVTTTTYAACVIDNKIEKKDPLWIGIGVPDHNLIVSKVLLPIIEYEIEQQDQAYELDEEINDDKFIRTILDSIVRYCRSDIKKAMNQTQVLWSTNSFSWNNVHMSLNLKLDVDFLSPVVENENPIMNKTIPKCRQEEMDQIAQNLEFVTDLDQIVFSSLPNPEQDSLPLHLHNYFEFNFIKMLQKWKDEKNYDMVTLFRSLMLETDKLRAEREMEEKLYDELVDSHVEKEHYDEVGYIRTIVKTNVLNSSVGHNSRRNGRPLRYFSGMPKTHVDSICDTFDFPTTLQIVKQSESEDFFQH